MAVNVSEATELIAFGTAKSIALHYLQQRKSNMQAIELTAEDALNAKKAEDEQKKQTGLAEKRQVDVDDVDDVGDPAGKKKRRKCLKLSAEEINHRAAKREGKEAAPIENAESDGMAETKTESASAKRTSSSDCAMRSISFRLFPSPELATRLLTWLDIADATDAHVKELAESFAQRGDQFTPEFIRDYYISLSGKRYRSLEKTDNFKTVPKDSDRRWKTLYFGAESMSVKGASDEVTIWPKMNFLALDADRGLCISDSLLCFLMPVTTETIERGSRAPTKHWGNHLLCPKEDGHAFAVRFDADTQNGI
ncbi:hypothetical protein HK104_003599 [Borealophlyctis nickersoniae]|nr:hypothetical protein HK104_003599 [Borealophlyctis nickersoniae]